MFDLKTDIEKAVAVKLATLASDPEKIAGLTSWFKQLLGSTDDAAAAFRKTTTKPTTGKTRAALNVKWNDVPTGGSGATKMDKRIDRYNKYLEETSK